MVAICHDKSRFSVLFYSSLDSNEKMLFAYYQPSVELLQTTVEKTDINVNINSLNPLLATNLSQLDTESTCSSMSMNYSDLTNSYTFYAKGKQVSVYLSQSEVIIAYDEDTGE